MVNKNILRSRIEKIYYHLSRIKSSKKISYELFKGNQDVQDVVEYNLFQTMNHLIDICQHIVVDEGYGFPEAAYEAVDFLAQKKILTTADSSKLRKNYRLSQCCGA